MEASSIPCGTKWLAALHVKVRSLSNLVGANVRIDVLIFPSAESCKNRPGPRKVVISAMMVKFGWGRWKVGMMEG